MGATWDDEYLTVSEIAEHLKGAMMPPARRHYAEPVSASPPSPSATGSMPAVRIGCRGRVPRAELDRLVAQGTTATVTAAAEPRTAEPAEASDVLAEALERAKLLLGRRNGVRRAELAQGLQELSEAAEAALQMLSDGVSRTTSDTKPER
jgi:hypothetical protein